MQSLSIATVIDLLSDEDVELAEYAADLLKTSNETQKLLPEDWLKLLTNSNVDVVPKLCELAARSLSAESLSMDQVLVFACSRTSALVQLALDWLRKRDLRDEERSKSLVLIDAQCEAHREAFA